MRNRNEFTDEDLQRMAQLMGADLGAPDEMPLKPIVTVKITGTSVGDLELGDNKYVGKMVLNEIAPTEASWLEDALDDSDLGFDTVDDCYVLDYANINNAGHSRETDDIVTGNVIGYAPDGRFIVAVTDGKSQPSFFPVLVVWSGGSDGDATNYATWTYNIYALTDTAHATPLTADAVQPENSPARIVYGPVTKAATDSVGQAYYAADGTVKLYTCAEKHGSCT